MFYSRPVLSDFGATKNAKDRVRARGITDARKLARNSPYISRFDLRETRDVIALPYEFLSFFLPPEPPGGDERGIGGRRGRGQTSIDILEARS